VLAPPKLRAFAIAAVLPGLALSYVQIPDRALWNFYYLWIPLAAIVLAALPPVWAWTFVVMFGVSNLRIGAQLPFVPPMRIPMAITIAIAIVAIVMKWRASRPERVMPEPLRA
jgi:membrane protein implicated in regulation of membrane protease activity